MVSETRFMSAMGMYRSGALSTRRVQEEGGASIPLSLAYKNLKPFVDKHLGSMHFRPLVYRAPEGALVTIPPVPIICETTSLMRLV